ncbi:copper homeostasis protein CutC [Carboxylicivirga marina]|uniref:PF03932 family protein CutC n=1 Tax=Carboxylicivirga marina TaxID=2800988 RepID=A0ABS1HFZ3_9BACT|nr:copper homeostasis protein CutC [Carboxylicivirga marina]MBK3516405.1 copper homeostasis protein CutC [Carboxylicivirga marina]
MNKELKFEICIDSVQSAINAQAAGAHRVELCDNLFEGGTTPSAGMIKQVKNIATDIKVFIIIRPRGGDFVYSNEEIEVMLADIEIAKQLGADGFVSGCLLKSGEIDVKNTKKLIAACGDLPFTFHRAFDMCKDPFIALNKLIDIGVSRILTSGMEQTALLGVQNISKLVEKAANKITILVGSGIKPDNIAKIGKITKASEFHFSARKTFDSPMEYKNEAIKMGGIPGLPEFNLFYSDFDIIKETIKAAQNIYIK